MTLDRLPAALAVDRDRAFPDLVRALQDDVYSGALRMLGNRSDAEDVTQEAFVNAYRALGGYEPARIRSLRVKPWVWTIAANLCRNRLRSARRRPETALPSEVSLPDPAPGTEQQALASAGLAALAAAVAALPWPMRSAVVLRHVADLGYDEIAEALGRPAGTVKSDVHRGLVRLRDVLTPKEAT